jgi:hypothetical protein
VSNPAERCRRTATIVEALFEDLGAFSNPEIAFSRVIQVGRLVVER